MPAPRVSLILAVTGGLLFFAGDQLFYGHFGPGADLGTRVPTIVASRSVAALALGGALGPIGSFALLLGALHLRTRFVEKASRSAAVTTALFAATFVLAGAVHAVWGAFAFVVRGSDGSEVARAIWDDVGAYLDGLHLGATVLGLVAAVAWSYAVATRRTDLPRGFAFANPGLAYLALFLGGPLVPAPVGAPLVGGAFGLSCALFFGALMFTVPTARERRRD